MYASSTLLVVLLSFIQFFMARAVPVPNDPTDVVTKPVYTSSSLVARGDGTSPESSGAAFADNLLFAVSGGKEQEPSLSVGALVESLLNVLGLTEPLTSTPDEVSNIVVEIDLGLGDALFGLDILVDKITEAVDSLLSSLLQITVKSKRTKKHSSSGGPLSIDLGLRLSGHCSGSSLGHLLSDALKTIIAKLDSILGGIGVIIKLDLNVDALVKV